MWTYADAVNLAINAYNAREISLEQLDSYATEIWQEMQADDSQWQ